MSDVMNLFSRYCNKLQKQSGSQFIALCPFHDDTKPSLSINIEGLYYCHTCGAKGNAVDFAKHFNENPKPFYSDNQTPIKNRHISVKQEWSRNKTKIQKSCDVSALVRKYHKEHYNSKWSNIYQVGEWNGHQTFTYYDLKGKKPIAIHHHKSAPHWEGQERSFKWYMEWHIPYMDKTEPLHIVEGEKDVITMMDEGFNAVSGSAGCKTYKYVPHSFKQFPKIIILLDFDEHGDEGALKCAQLLYEELGIQAFIAEWDKSLPIGYDVTDDKENSNG